MKITHVIRGEEWLPSYPKHDLLYKAFGWDTPQVLLAFEEARLMLLCGLQFAHLPLLLNEDKSKLSKRHGDVAIKDHQTKGYLPEGLVNFVVLLGWNPGAGSTEEVFNMDRLVEEVRIGVVCNRGGRGSDCCPFLQFSLEQVNKGGGVVLKKKLLWLNAQHIKRYFEVEDDTDPRWASIVAAGREVPPPAHESAVCTDTLLFALQAFVKHFDDAGRSDTNRMLSEFSDAYVWRVMHLMRVRCGRELHCESSAANQLCSDVLTFECAGAGPDDA
jgi:glutamyl/glutaminyl-tRNA synthetase